MIKLHIFPINERFALCTKPPIIKQDTKPKNNPNLTVTNIDDIADLISEDPNNKLIKGTDNKLFVPVPNLQDLQTITLTQVKQDFEEINK